MHQTGPAELQMEPPLIDSSPSADSRQQSAPVKVNKSNKLIWTRQKKTRMGEAEGGRRDGRTAEMCVRGQTILRSRRQNGGDRSSHLI